MTGIFETEVLLFGSFNNCKRLLDFVLTFDDGRQNKLLVNTHLVPFYWDYWLVLFLLYNFVAQRYTYVSICCIVCFSIQLLLS